MVPCRSNFPVCFLKVSVGLSSSRPFPSSREVPFVVRVLRILCLFGFLLLIAPWLQPLFTELLFYSTVFCLFPRRCQGLPPFPSFFLSASMWSVPPCVRLPISVSHLLALPSCCPDRADFSFPFPLGYSPSHGFFLLPSKLPLASRLCALFADVLPFEDVYGSSPRLDTVACNPLFF